MTDLHPDSCRCPDCWATWGRFYAPPPRPVPPPPPNPHAYYANRTAPPATTATEKTAQLPPAWRRWFSRV